MRDQEINYSELASDLLRFANVQRQPVAALKQKFQKKY